MLLKVRDDSCTPPLLAYMVLRTKPRVFCALRNYSRTVSFSFPWVFIQHHFAGFFLLVKLMKAPAAGCLLPTREADKTHSNESVSNIVIYKIKCQGNTQVQGK